MYIVIYRPDLRAGKIRFSVIGKSVLLKPSSGECCVPWAPCNVRRYTCSIHRVPPRSPNEIYYAKINVETNWHTAVSTRATSLTWRHWETLAFVCCLHYYFWRDSTPFFSILLLNLRECCWLRLPAEIKAQTSENYENGNYRYKICHINQNRSKCNLKKNPNWI